MAIPNIIAESASLAKPWLSGKTFKARVVKLWGEIAEGQLTPTTAVRMISFSKTIPPGRIPVQIEILDDMSQYYIPVGTSSGVTVYSEHLAFLGELRRIFLHLFSWQNIIAFDES